MREFRKIHIFGAYGSGTGALAEKISERTGIKAVSLDDIYWDSSKGPGLSVRSPDERDSLLMQIVKSPAWILEGPYYSWVGEGFSKADMLVYVDVRKSVLAARTVLFYFAGLFGFRRSGWSGGEGGLFARLKWNAEHNRNLQEIIYRQSLKREVMVLKNRKEIESFVGGFRRA